MTKRTRRQLLQRTAASTSGLMILSGSASAHQKEHATFDGPHSVPHIGTRGHYSTEEKDQKADSYAYHTDGECPGLDDGYGCPEDITIFVHGWTNDREGAHKKADRVRDCLDIAGYSGNIAEYTWDSDTINWWDGSPYNAWVVGKYNAGYRSHPEDGEVGNCNALAHAILNIRINCPDAPIRVVAHSLGCRVALLALDALQEDWDYWDEDDEIFSLHLVGAAVPYTWVDESGPLGYEIRTETRATFNYHSRHDGTIDHTYSGWEDDEGLGSYGADGEDSDTPADPPCNYHDEDVSNEVGGHSKYFGKGSNEGEKIAPEILHHMANVTSYDC